MNGAPKNSGPVRPAMIWMIPVAVIALAMAMIASDAGGLASALRGFQFDFYERLQPRPYAPTLSVTGYSVRTLDFSTAPPALQEWPPSRAALARLVGALRGAGAAVVVIDAPLSSPDPLSPVLFAQGLPPDASEGLRHQLGQLPSQDRALAAALASVHAVTAVHLTALPGQEFASQFPLTLDGPPSALASLPEFAGAAIPLPELARASAAMGANNLVTDRDGIARAMPMVLREGGRPVPSLAASVMRLIGGAPLTAVADDSALDWLPGRARLIRLSSGSVSVPLRTDGAMGVWFTGEQAARSVPIADLMAGKLGATALAHSIVFVADPAASVATPLGRESRGQFDAEAMENVLTGTALRQSNGLAAQLAFLFFAGLAAILLLARTGLVWSGVFTLAAVLAADGFTWMLFSRDRVLFDSANASVWLLLAFGAAAAARLAQMSASRFALRQTFDGALARPALERIARAPSMLRLEGETRTVTCLCVGLRGYAELAAAFIDDPAGFNRLLGVLMPPLIEAATAQGALVDCVTAGSFNAYWNAPLDDPEHAIHACEAATRMTVVLAEVNEQLSRERRSDGTSYEALEIGIGLATGPAAVGGFPMAGRLHYAVAGECTALAERIRTLSGRYGPAIIAADATRSAAQRGYAFLEVDFAAIESGGAPVKLFALLGNPVVRASPKFRALATFHEHIFQSVRTQQWGKARDLIDQCRKLSGASQKLYDLHLARIAWFEQHPPGSDWDGAFRELVS